MNTEDVGVASGPLSEQAGPVGSPVLAKAIRYRRWLGPCLLAGVGAAVLASLLLPPRFVARVTILPRQSPTNLGWLRDFSGLQLPGGTPGESLEALYSRIIESDRVLDGLATASWRGPGDMVGRELHDLLRVRRNVAVEDSAKALLELKKRLRRRVLSFDRDPQTGFMEMKVAVPRHPWLAAALADSLVLRLDAFMQEYRAGKAQEQAEFIAQRVDDTESKLREADEALARFVTANRLYEQSITLLQEHRRLSREVDALTAVWLELRRQLELARIESNDRKQSLDVLDHARLPVERAWPKHTLSAMAGVALGLVAWSIIVIGSVTADGLAAALQRARQP